MLLRGKAGLALVVVASLFAAFACLLLARSAAAAPGIDASWGNVDSNGKTEGGLFSLQPRGIATNSSSGQIYIADSANNRIQRFDPALSSDPSTWFLSTWGRDVDQAGGTEVETCTVAATCKGGITGTRGGEFSAPAGLAIDQSTGNLYVIDTSNNRVQEMGSAGAFLRAWGAGVVSGGASGIGTLNGTTSVTAVVTTGKAFEVGQTITGPGIPANTRITAVAANTVTLSQAATESGPSKSLSVAEGAGNVATNEIQTITLTATGGTFNLSFSTPNPSPTAQTTTANIPFNGSAGAVQSALEALSNIGAGNVAVSGSAGGPFAIEFKGARFADTNVAQLGLAAGAPPLSGGTASIATATQGASGAEICTVAVSCKAGITGTGAGAFGSFGEIEAGQPGNGLMVAPAGAPNAGDVLVADAGNRRVQEFSANGTFVRTFGADAVKSGPDNVLQNEQQSLVVSAAGGTFTLQFGAASTAALPFNVPASGGVGPTASVQNALEALAGIGSGNVTVSGGPGDGLGTNPYLIDFGGALANTDVAQITSNATGLSAVVGKQLSCAATPTASRVTRSYQWFANGLSLGAANGGQTSTYTVQAADAGKAIQCVVKAVNTVEGEGSGFAGAVAASAALIVAPFPSPSVPTPPSVAAPTGTVAAGQNLTCNAGSWGNSPTAYTYRWYRNGEEISGAGATEVASISSTYTLTNVDVATRAAFQCTVAAKNAGGTVLASSGRKIPIEAPKPEAPAATASVASLALAATTVAGTAAFEVCGPADVCKAGIAGAAVGQFAASTPTRVAEDKTGRIYTVEPSDNFRVQRFTLPGNVPTPQGEFAAAALHGTPSGSGAQMKIEPRNNTTEIAVDDAGNVYAVKWIPRGTGTPPVLVNPENSQAQAQQRILKLDPTSEEVTEAMAGNPDRGVEGGAFTFENVAGLSVAGAGEPIYATTGAGDLESVPRAWRVQEIGGLGASEIEATEVGASTATLRAAITPAQISLGSAYRFEYSEDGVSWLPAPVPDAKIGNGSEGGTSSSCPTPKAAVCRVTQAINNLIPNTTYQMRIVIYTLFDKGQAQTIDGEEFTTKAEPPLTITGAAHWSSPPSTGPSLALGGTVNPGHDATTYSFQYVDEASYQADKGAGGDGFAQASAAPVTPALAGHGLRNVTVREVVAELDPSLVYRYRLVAANSVGTALGATRSVVPPSTVERFYEQVSAGDSWGSGVLGEKGLGDIADSGERALFYALAFGQPRSLASPINPFVAERGADGWKVSGMLADPSRVARGARGGGANTSTDLGAMAWAESSAGELARSEASFGLARIDGSLVPASAQLVPVASSGSGSYEPIGAGGDLGSIVFRFFSTNNSTNVALLAGEPLLPANRFNLYEIAGAGGSSPALEIVNRANGPAGAILGGACGAGLGGTVATHAVSADGSVVYFNARPTAPGGSTCVEASNPRRLYKRIDGETTVEVSKSTCIRTVPTVCDTATDGDDSFRGASADGRVVLFTSPRQLTDSDEDTTSDLYAYDTDPPTGQPNLVQVSAGETVGAHVAGKGAKVQGVIDNAEDGSRVYFVAEGVLTGPNLLGKLPSTAAGARNLYVYERDVAHPSGRIAFVATLVAGDQSEWESGDSSSSKYAAALPVKDGTGDGHALILRTSAKLLAVDTDSFADVYLYDDSPANAAHALRCLSCAGNGEFEVRVSQRKAAELSLPDYAQQARIATTDLSTVVFSSREALLSGDENTTWDAYGWQAPGTGGCTEAAATPTRTYFAATGGCLELLSAGSEGFGIETDKGFHQAMISPDGRDVFFLTTAPLVGTDTNNAPDVYDARVGGGFPEQAQTEDCGGESSCQPPLPAPPSASPQPGSEGSGSGNPPPAKQCKKSQVKKHGKCVKKPTGKNKDRKHHHKRGANR